MHTEIAIGDLQQLLEVVEAEDFIYRQRTHDGQAHALVNQRIEFQALGWLSGNFAGASARNCGNASCAIGVGLGHNGLPKINVLQKIKCCEGCHERNPRNHKPSCAPHRVFPVSCEEKNQSRHQHQDDCDLKDMCPG